MSKIYKIIINFNLIYLYNYFFRGSIIVNGSIAFAE